MKVERLAYNFKREVSLGDDSHQVLVLRDKGTANSVVLEYFDDFIEGCSCGDTDWLSGIEG